MRFAIATDCLLSDKYERNYDEHVPEISNKQFSLSKGCHDQLYQMMSTGQAVLIKIHVFCQEHKKISVAGVRSNVSVLW